MALNRYSTSSRFSPKTTDPITKARIADPNKMGKVSPQGTTMITSWPEFRESYERGELPDDILTGGQGDLPKDIVSYMKGETNILSEGYAEPEYNINPDTQKVGHYKDPADPSFAYGDLYGDGSNIGKKNIGMIRYDADNKKNRSMINKKAKEMKLSGFKLKDYIQGDTVASGIGSGSYSEEEMAGLYPDLQVGGNAGMSDFSQSVYRPSKKQIAEEKKRESETPPPPPPPPSKQEIAGFMEEGPSRLKLIEPGMLKGGNRKLVGLDRDKGEYVDPKKPFVSYDKAYKQKFPNKKARRRANFEALFKKNGLGASKPERVKGGFKNLGEKRKYKTEEKLAKATYGRGLEQITGSELSERKASLKERKREQMKGGNFFKNLSANQEARKEIRDINRAQKYSKLVGGSETNRNIYSVSDRASRNMIDKEKNPGPKYFKPETMKNFRSSKNNPLNRNSISGFFE